MLFSRKAAEDMRTDAVTVLQDVRSAATAVQDTSAIFFVAFALVAACAVVALVVATTNTVGRRG